MGIAPPADDATNAEIRAYVVTSLWKVVSEEIGARAIVGEVMKVERASSLGPWGGNRWVITPAHAGASDERFAGAFARVKPFVKNYKDGKLHCTGGIVLIPAKEQA
jgi:hypothetical protein